MKKLGALIGAGLLLTGCTAPTAEPAGAAFCDTLTDELDAYVSFVFDTASGSVDVVEAERLITWADDLESQTPEDAGADVVALLGPIREIEAVIDAGGGSLEFTTTDYKVANIALLDYCVEHG